MTVVSTKEYIFKPDDRFINQDVFTNTTALNAALQNWLPLSTCKLSANPLALTPSSNHSRHTGLHRHALSISWLHRASTSTPRDDTIPQLSSHPLQRRPFLHRHTQTHVHGNRLPPTPLSLLPDSILRLEPIHPASAHAHGTLLRLPPPGHHVCRGCHARG